MVEKGSVDLFLDDCDGYLEQAKGFHGSGAQSDAMGRLWHAVLYLSRAVRGMSSVGPVTVQASTGRLLSCPVEHLPAYCQLLLEEAERHRLRSVMAMSALKELAKSAPVTSNEIDDVIKVLEGLP